MPYIKQEDRPKFQEILMTLPPILTRGELNYLLSSIVATYLRTRKAEGHKIDYDELQDVKGTLSEVMDEYRSRLILPYEKTKLAANGDVYGGIL